MNKSIEFIASLARLLLILVISVMSMTASATSYVTFQDGHLLVLPDECIQSVTQDDETLTVIALDGSVFSYALANITSISSALTKELPTIVSYKFNNKYNYQLIGDAEGVITDNNEINIEVAGIGKRLTASFTLSDNRARVLVDGVVQQSKVSRLRFDTPRVYTIGYENDEILMPQQEGGYDMEPFGREYVVNVDFLTDHAITCPRIDINTVGGVNITSKVNYVDAEIIIDGAGVFPSMTDSVQIRGRGNTSWSSNPNAKNPYRLKFASKVKPLGLTKGKNWVLLANKLSGSQLTNAIGMKAASLIGTVAANHIIPVDLYINGTYKGSYNFTEKVGFAGNSVDLDDETAAALLELDTYYDEATTQKFKSTPYQIPVNIKHPEFSEDETVLTLNDIKSRFNAFVAAAQNGEDLSTHVDIEALCRYLMFNEYIRNMEMFHPKSTFCYNENILSDSSRFIFGPAWDFDWACGYNGTQASSYFVNNITSNYYNAELTQREFFNKLHDAAGVKQRIYELWMDFKANQLDELCEYCEDYYAYAKFSLNKNKNAGLDSFNYANQVPNAITWLRQRANFICSQLHQELFIIGDVDGNGEINIADVTYLIDYLLTGDSSLINMDNADVDEDGKLAISDVTALIDLILN